MTLQIKTLTSKNWKTLKTIRLDALKSNPESFGTTHTETQNKEDSYWIEQITNPDNKILVAFDEQKPIGMIRITTNDPEIPTDFVYLGSLYVKAEYRKLGIATKLVTSAEDNARKANSIKGIYLEVYKSSANAVALYQKLGYKIEKELLIDGQEELIMVKMF